MLKKIGLVALALFVVISFALSGDYTGEGKLKGFVYNKNGNPLEGVAIRSFRLKTAVDFNVGTESKGEWKNEKILYCFIFNNWVSRI